MLESVEQGSAAEKCLSSAAEGLQFAEWTAVMDSASEDRLGSAAEGRLAQCVPEVVQQNLVFEGQ